MSAKEPIPLFLHIPKTAGSTLSNLVYENYAASDASRGAYPAWYGAFPGVWVYYTGFKLEEALEPPTPDMLRALSHPSLRAVLGHFTFGLHENVPRPSTYVTILRDPIERALSLYAHAVVWLRDMHGIVSEDLTLSEFVSRRAPREIDNGQVRRLCGTDFPVGKCSQRILARAKHNLSTHFSFVGLTERFDETVLVLAQKLGWKRHLYWSKLVNRHRNDIELPSERALATLHELTRFDAELYAFAEELFNAEVEMMGTAFHDDLQRFRAEQAEFAGRWTRKPVNLNTGTVEELASLPRIGPVLAQRIVDVREASGTFSRVQQLLQIPGIGPKRYWDLVMLVATSNNDSH